MVDLRIGFGLYEEKIFTIVLSTLIFIVFVFGILFKNELLSLYSLKQRSTGVYTMTYVGDYGFDIETLYEYAMAVKSSTDEWLKSLQYEETKKKFGDDDKKRLVKLGVVSNEENAVRLIDHWCNKDILGLIKMPLSRHWIMHIEAANRIKEKIINM